MTFTSLSTEKMLSLHEMMLMIRRFEEKTGQLYGMGKIAGFCHLYIGQEAVVVGSYAAMNQDKDTMITAYRDHGHMLACGMDAGRVMAELMGKSTGYSKGKGGSMHMFSREKRFFGGHGIVGAQVSIGTGIAFAHQYQKDNGVCIVFMGEGASNQGQVYESLNMAALWKLPVVYIIENNGYGIGTSVERSSAGNGLFQRARGYGIEGIQVDGMNLESVFNAVSNAYEKARNGHGPAWLELMTYRYRGHSVSDPATYRARSEVDDMRKNHDPITQFQRYLQLSHNIKDEYFQEMITRVNAFVEDAIIFSENSDIPQDGALYEDVYIKTESYCS